MFEMVSSHSMKNLALTEEARAQGACGVILRARIKTGTVPSSLHLSLKNAQSSVVLTWDKAAASLSISYPVLSESNLGYSQLVTHGQTHKHRMPTTGSYPFMDVTMSVVGHEIAATMRENGKTVASLSFPVHPDPLINMVDGWQVHVTSYPTDPGSGFEITRYSIACDESTSGRIITDYFTLSPEDVSRKYITLSEPPSRSISLNVAQATTQRRGVDFAVLGRRISWDGYGIDQPHLMKVGIGVRVIYTAGAWGVPWVSRIGKNLVGLSNSTKGNLPPVE